MERLAATSEEPTYGLRERSRLSIDLDQFDVLAQIGKGNSATVVLAQTRDTNELRAIKILKKDILIENDEVTRLYREKYTLLKARDHAHPFIAWLYSTFQTETRACFVMEYLAGGDLNFHIQKGEFGVERSR